MFERLRGERNQGEIVFLFFVFCFRGVCADGFVWHGKRRVNKVL